MSVIPPSLGTNVNTIFQPLNEKPAPGTRPYYPSITNISTEPRPDGTEAVYVQTFLIQAGTRNQKGWNVSYDNPADFDRRVQESLNHPLVLFPTADKGGTLIYDHPIAPVTSLEAAADPLRANIEFQKKYTIGHARFFKKIKDGLWAATYEIVNNKAKRFFLNAKNKGIKLFTSPYIVRPANEDRTNIKEWALIHNAIVSQPAYGDIANIKNVCVSNKGDPYTCQSLFASITAVDDDLDFDVESALEVLTSQIVPELTIASMKEESASAVMEQPTQQPPSSAAAAAAQQATVSTSTTPLESKITDIIPDKQLVEKPGQEEQDKQQQNDPSSKEPNKTDELESLKSELETLKQKYAYDTRKASIEKIFAPIAGVIYADKSGEVDEKEYNAEINRLTKEPYKLEHIQELAQARYVIAQYQQQQGRNNRKNERASITSFADETNTANYTKMATTTTNSQDTCPNKLGFNVLRKTLGGF